MLSVRAVCVISTLLVGATGLNLRSGASVDPPLDSAYNMHAPYVEPKGKIEQYAVSPAPYGKGQPPLSAGATYANPMGSPTPAKSIGGVYGMTPGALNTPASHQPTLSGLSKKPENGMIRNNDAQPIPGASGYLPPAPITMDKDEKGTAYLGLHPGNKPQMLPTTNPSAYPVDVAAARVPGGVIGAKGWPANSPLEASPHNGNPAGAGLFGLSAKPFQEVPGSRPRPISAPGFPYAGNSVLGEGTTHDRSNPYFPGTTSNSVVGQVEAKDGYIARDPAASARENAQGLSDEEEDLLGHHRMNKAHRR